MSPLLRPLLGIELTHESARAVAISPLSGAVVGFAEVAFDPANPAAAVRALRATLGDTGSISLAVGYAYLHLNAVRLPPVPSNERAAILALEPDRFFPVSGSVAVGLIGEGLASATDAAALERWCAAFAEWGAVHAVLAAPSAAAVALAGLSDGSGVFAVPDELSVGESAVVEIRDGRLVGARRVPAAVSLVTTPMPHPRGVDPRFAVAAGAAFGASLPLHEQLLSTSLRARLSADRTRRTSYSWLLVAASLLFVLWSFDHGREQTLRQLQVSVTQLTDSAAGALALQSRLGTLTRATPATNASGANDPIQVLAVLSDRLPRDATVLALAANGDVWHLDGRAGSAAAIVPALDADPRVADVRLAGPTTRFTENGRTYESFSIALRARSSP